MIKKAGLFGMLFAFLLSFSVDALAYPNGYRELFDTGDPNMKILVNNNRGVVVLILEPIGQDVFDDENIAEMKNTISCERYDLSQDRKTVTGTGCRSSNTRSKGDVYATIIDRTLHVVVYTDKVSKADAIAIGTGK